MTTVFFVRHAEPNYNNHDDMSRELTEKGWSDRKRVTAFLQDKGVTRAFSSPFKRSVDTISDFTESAGLSIATDYDFRERKVGDSWLDDFASFAERQWSDFDYKLENGESLAEVQERNLRALYKILNSSNGETVVVGTHGTALSTLVNYFDQSFGHKDFLRIQEVMPWIVEMTFNGSEFIQWKEHQL